jgi:osmotically-inducible protein OsmY
MRTLWASPDHFTLDVDGGEVTIDGTTTDAESAAVLTRLVERVPGVVQVRSRVTWPG